MKRLAIYMILCAAAFALSATPAIAEGSPETPIVTTLLSDGSTNVWTQADLVAALQLLNRKYHRDCETPSGRAAWHGKRVSHVTDANAFTVTEIYADGTVFVDAAPVETPSQSVAKHNSRLTTTMTNGVPDRLARARMMRHEEKATTNTVTVVVTPDK